MTYFKNKKAVTLVEIAVSIFVLGLAAIPMIGLFTGYYNTATRQLEQDVALKIADSTLSVFMNKKYSELADSQLTTVPLDILTSDGTFPIKLIFNGLESEVAILTVGRNKYEVSVEIKKIFRGQNLYAPHSDAIVFKYMELRNLPNKSVEVYNGFDDLILIAVTVAFGGEKPIRLACFRADMVR